MKKKYEIRNLDELHSTIAGLKIQTEIQRQALVSDTKHYLRQFTIGNIVKKYATPSTFLKADEKLNISSRVMSLVLPFLMNNTIFRGSGFLTKTLVGLASGKVGKSLDAEHLSGMFNKVKSWFGGSKHKPVVVTKAEFADYGIQQL